MRWTVAFPALVVLLAAGACDRDTPGPAEPSLDVAAASAFLAFRHISAGHAHTCGVTTDNRGYCWGGNFNGELGIGSRDQDHHLRPVAVSGGLRFLEVRAGASYTCGLTTDERIYCWGLNASGQLGIGSTATRRLVPTLVAGGRRWRQLRVGHTHSCALTTSGAPFCWGSNFSGAIGDGTLEDRLVPTRIKSVGQIFTRLSAGASYTCGVTSENQGYCWGNNVAGQLGIGTTFRRTKPTRIQGGHLWRQVSAGYGHTCGVTTGDKAYCWGSNTNGAVGDGTIATRLTPVAVKGDLRFSGIDPGELHTCGVNTTRRVYCWGSNHQGQLGLGDAVLEDQQQLTPAPVVGGLTFDAVLAGRAHTCALTRDAAAYCWGDNFGLLGDGTTERRLAPVRVVGP